MRKILTVLATFALVIAPVFALTYSVPVFAQDDDWDWDYTTDTTTDDDGVFAGVSMVVWCCCMAVAMLIPLAIAFVVYKDAVKKGVDNPMLWAIIVFFTGLLGLLIYLLVARNKK
jgi:glucan phosphoethanolaminetransferase (alkaline phosphatase superfamily)